MTNIFERSTGEQQAPSFDKLREALPEKLRDEFRELGDVVFKLSGGKMGVEEQTADGEEEKKIEEFTSEEKQVKYDRYNELEGIAKNNLKGKNTVL